MTQRRRSFGSRSRIDDAIANVASNAFHPGLGAPSAGRPVRDVNAIGSLGTVSNQASPGLGGGMSAPMQTDLMALLNAAPTPSQAEINNFNAMQPGPMDMTVPTAAEVTAMLAKYTPAGTPAPVPAPATVPAPVPAPATVPAPVPAPVIVPPPDAPVPVVPPGPVAPAPAPFYQPADLAPDIRSIIGERTTQDFSDQISDLIAGRRTDTRGLNAEALAALAEAVARRRGSEEGVIGGQIGDIRDQLSTDIGSLETGRLEQQQALIDAIAGRGSGLTTGVEGRLTAAREALGPQVSDEFERTAQLVSGLAGSQSTSSQDAMARLAQVANMAERQAAPGQLAAESALALGDQEFGRKQELSRELSSALAGLNAEETQRLMDESMRQENFNLGRDADLSQALLGDVFRREDFKTRESERLQGQSFQTGERLGSQSFQTGERLGSQTFAGKQAGIDRSFRSDEAQLDRDLREDESRRARQFQERESKLGRDLQRDQMSESTRRFNVGRFDQTNAATVAFQRSQQQIAEGRTYEDKIQAAQRTQQETAAAAMQAGSAQAASFFLGYAVDDPAGPVIWDSLPDGAKTQVYKDKIAAEDAEGKRWPDGTYQQLLGKYGEKNSHLILHAEAMVNMTPEQRAGYESKLATPSGLDNPALDANEMALINVFLDEMTLAQQAQQAEARQWLATEGGRNLVNFHRPGITQNEIDNMKIAAGKLMFQQNAAGQWEPRDYSPRDG